MSKIDWNAKIPSLEEQYGGTLPSDKIPVAKEDLAEMEQRLAGFTPQNSCGSALFRLTRRIKLRREQIARSIEAQANAGALRPLQEKD